MISLKNGIADIVKKYKTQEIEAVLIKLFLKHHGIKNIKNELLLDYLKNSNEILEEKLSELVPIKNIKSIERIFELLIEPADRKLNGAFYTPNFIVKYIVNNTICGDIKVCDPSCGSGAFLIEAAEKIHKDTGKSIFSIIENNIYGCDILDYSVKRTKLLLSLLSVLHGEDRKQIRFNLICEDSLVIDWSKKFPDILKSGDWKDIFGMSEHGFDAVIGNPPYVRIQDLGLETKKNLIKRWKTVTNGSFNIYFPFFELGVKLLRNGGLLGYITPNNYFTSLAAEPLRKYLQGNKLLSKILDFNHLQIFEDVTTYTCITLLEKNRKEIFEYQIIEELNKLDRIEKAAFSSINFKDLDYKKWRLLNEEDYNNIVKIESVGRTLSEVADIHVGIATLKDVLYFVDGSKEENGFYIKEFNGKKFYIEKEITKHIRKISAFENEEDIKKDKRRIICPYIIRREKAEIIPETELKKKFPKCYEYFLEIKDELGKRDKGKKQYGEWYAYGRGQGINRIGKKLLTPTFSNKPKFMFDANEESLFCNGYAVFQKNRQITLKALQKVLNSVIMDYFARKTSVDIEGGYQCYQKNFIESFNIPHLSEQDILFLENEESRKKVDEFLIRKYNLNKGPLEHLMQS